ncbi:MAG: hypothetical protein J7K36_06945 [Archaeoglobaceae archaeon]|nr:hypothetical protein [Archaeoglobaceae archaeon]
MLQFKPHLGIVITEAIYSSIIFALCFLLYYRIRKAYKLTDYKGLYLFSNTFLYLGLAYFLRFIVSSFAVSNAVFDLNLQFNVIKGLMLFSLTFMAYSSSAAIMYLISSLLWRWVDKVGNELFVHSIAILIAISPFIGKSLLLLLISQFLLLLALILSITLNYKYQSSKKIFSQAYIVYVLLFIFWILNLSLTFKLIPSVLRIAIYMLSLVVMGFIAYKILRKL